jgi:hypothetical protein
VTSEQTNKIVVSPLHAVWFLVVGIFSFHRCQRGMEASNHHPTIDEFVVLVTLSHRRSRYDGVVCVIIVVALGLLFQADRVTEQLDLLWSSSKTSMGVMSTDADKFQEVEDDSFDGIISCVWSPSLDAPDCFPLLMAHLQQSLNASRTRFWQNRRVADNDNKRRRHINRRWLFLGDSTVFRLFLDSQVGTYLLWDANERYRQQRGLCYSSHYLNCNSIYCQRCNTMSQLSLVEASSGWIPPDFTLGEGPTKFGLSHPYCSDCNGCNTNLRSCSLWKADDAPCPDAATTRDSSSVYTGPAYGGYMSVEFARDVELQTDQYKTTQENLLSLYIAEQWNAPIEMIEEFGRPLCVVGGGHHDIVLPNITKEIYLENVHWYLGILSQQCDFIVWMANNSPQTDDYAQTLAATFEWNMAVQDILLTNREFRRKSFFLDVFNASIEYPHVDNIHMEATWYAALATFVRRVMDADLGWYESY